ncbi:MAG: YCF48-related protein [Chitinophagaceae bacterium]
MKNLLLLALLISSTLVHAQKTLPKLKLLSQDINTNIRGLSVVNDVVVWASGSNGTIGKTTDGGKTWKWIVVKGFEKRDFRDIEAFSSTTAIIMSIDTPAYILKTIDGGNSWKVVYENKTPGMFLDAMEFWNEEAGIVIGDPIDGKFFIARTFDGGNTWKEIPENFKPLADEGEALFAASGTNIRILDRDEAVFVTGGTSSHIYIRDKKIKLPINQGKESTGANSVAVMDYNSRSGGKTLTVVGGDFANPTSDSLNCFYSNDRGKTWRAPKNPPAGYRSSVEYLSKLHIITCGTTGVDYSFDGGKNWKPISDESFHVVRISKKGAATYLAGANGRVARLDYEPGLKN